MSEGRLDPAAVREARKAAREAMGAATALWSTNGVPFGAVTSIDPLHLSVLLAALDEGREASAPFAVVVADYKKQTQVESDPDYPMLGRIGWEEDPRPPQVRWRELDRLAAWSEAVSEPEGVKP